MATSEGIPSSIDIEFLELNDNPYIIYDNQLVTICDQFAVFCLFRYVCHIYIHFQNHKL